MSQTMHSPLWETDEAPAVRKFKLWQKASYGASLTLGKRPPIPTKRNFVSAVYLPLPKPLTTIPPDRPDNRQAILDEVFAHHQLEPGDIVQRHGTPRATCCLQELAYRLLTYGKRSGNRLSYVEVGQMLQRHHASVRYSQQQHARRMRQIEVEDAGA